MAVADCSWFEYYLAPRPGERLVEVERLRALGEDCIPLLCGHLRDSRLRVRTIAAWTLADVGDERAVGPLCDALADADRGLSPWARCVATSIGLVCVAITTVLAVLAALVLTHVWLHTDCGESFQETWRENLASLRGHEIFVAAVVEALDRIIDRHPIPEARRALNPLRRLAEDTLRHDSSTREHASRTAHRIHMATLNCRRLPIAAAAPVVSPAGLPIPGGAPDEEGRSRASGCGIAPS